MIEVAPNLFVGSSADLVHALDHDHIDGDENVKDGWYVISAAKDPFHREALGYTTRGAPKDHEEYLRAFRPNRLILNLVDAADPTFIHDDLIWLAHLKIDDGVDKFGKKILIHCNEGKSRAPTIAMLWMAKRKLLSGSPDEVIDGFKSIYPDYAPAEGMRLYAQQWLEKHVVAA